MRTAISTRLLLALACTPFACGEATDDESGGAGGKGDSLEDKGICAGAVIDKRLGDDGTELADISELTDVFAQKVLQADGDEGCPTTYTEIMAKLRQTDKENCEGVRDGLRTAVVSETAQVMGKADSYRTVTTRQCGDRQPHELLFSLFGLTTKTSGLPGNVEVIAFDRTNKAFNYYSIEDGEMHFFGSSVDYLKFSDDEGARCNQCHPMGGLNMKELAAPWVHWEGDTTTPGASTLVDKHADDLGTKTDGIELESIVDSGNDALIETKTRTLLAQGDVKEVLRPLFCTVQINLEEGSSSAGGKAPSSIPGGALVDSRLGFGSVPVAATVYSAAIKSSKQKIVGNNGTQLKNKSGKGVVDTFFALSFPVISREDQNYIDKLIELKVIDEDFKQDVLAVDMTRPLFSADRCALLDSAPTITKLTTASGKAIKDLPKKIRDGFAANLAKAPTGSAGAQLAGFLANTADTPDHGKAASDFFAACDARPEADFMADALKVISLRRNQVRELPVMEFQPTLPVDSLNVAETAHLDPATCTLVP
ncbi:MAG: hypothetical protein U0168_19270 [Nannocystaceae bacterium]|jgi:hypothetical protein